jgi:hypothetical protein
LLVPEGRQGIADMGFQLRIQGRSPCEQPAPALTVRTGRFPVMTTGLAGGLITPYKGIVTDTP